MGTGLLNKHMSISAFRARCLELMRPMEAGGEPID